MPTKTVVEEPVVLELEPKQEQPVAIAPAPSQPGGALASITPMDLLRIAVDKNADLDRIEKMYGLVQQWRADEARNAFNEAMTLLKAEPMTIYKRKSVGYKTKDGDFVGYKHAELSDVIDAVVPAMSKHGLSHRWDEKVEGKTVLCTCVVRHRLGHSESITLPGPFDDSGKKNAIQQMASTVTYLRRYTLLGVLGLATTGEDNDGAGGDEGGDGSQNNGSSASHSKGDVQNYPQASFDANLPQWRELIAKGTKPEAIILKVEKKAPMTDEQKKILREPAAPAAPTYAQIAELLKKAGGKDAALQALDANRQSISAEEQKDLARLIDLLWKD